MVFRLINDFIMIILMFDNKILIVCFDVFINGIIDYFSYIFDEYKFRGVINVVLDFFYMFGGFLYVVFEFMGFLIDKFFEYKLFNL